MRFAKKILAIWICILLLGALTVRAWAAGTVVDSGTCGENVVWTLYADGELVISGAGPMADFIDEPAPWTNFRNSVVSLRVEEGVTGTGTYAFEKLSNLQSVSLPKSLESLGGGAFYDCTSLESITIPAGVTSIGRLVFFCCDNLTQIQVDPENQNYSNDASGVLYDKGKTTLVCAPCGLSGAYTIAPTATAIEANAFYDCTKLTAVTVPDGITLINVGAFSGCSALESVTLPSGLERIATTAFYGCESLKKIVIPASVTAVDDYAFEDCTGIKEILFCGDAPAIGELAFRNVTAAAYYPDGNETWTEAVRLSYGGTLSWEAYEAGTFCPGEHTFAPGPYVKQPGCTTQGQIRYECTFCDAYELRTVPATGHDNLLTVTPPSETTVGYTTCICQTCGYSIVEFNAGLLTYDDAILYIQDAMCRRERTISIEYKEDVPGNNSRVKVLYDKATAHNGVPTQGDYLSGCLKGMSYFGYNIQRVGDGYLNKATIQFTYLSTAEQEMQTNAAVQDILSQLNLDGKSDYQKVKAIHDFLCNHITYTMGSDVCHTAYSAAVNGQSVCQGYALLAYRLLLQVGVDNRYITGMGNGGAHAWNIVKLGDRYYNLDATWGDQVRYISYDYFLRSDGEFDDHIRDAEYTTQEFYAQYPMGQTSYVLGACGEDTMCNLSEDGTLTVFGTGAIEEKGFIYFPWEKRKDEIKKVVIEEGVNVIGWDAFKDCKALQEVIIPASVTEISFMAFDGCTALEKVTFLGSAPVVRMWAFSGVTATCYYPAGNSSWTEDTKQNYDGTLTWVPFGEACQHTYEPAVTAPTCTEQGYTTYTCTICWDTYVGDYVGLLPHDCTIVVVAPTCVDFGYSVYTCKNCTYTKTDDYTATAPHKYASVVVKPTCLEQGYTIHTCETCSHSYTDTYVKELGHSFGSWEVETPATCTQPGQQERACLRDGCGQKENDVLLAPGHLDTEPQDGLCDGCGQQMADVENEWVNPFADVKEDAFYYEPVGWAVQNGITNGTDATHFSPTAPCTRAQVVTFLWRAAGKPEPQSMENPFPDVADGKYFTKAVLWAAEQGITGGYKDGTFRPNNTCTRDQIVTFLWRYMGKPAPQSTEITFPDIEEGKFYTEAVLWAAEEGITGGFKGGTFGPSKTCTRDQIVTFLYRAIVE